MTEIDASIPLGIKPIQLDNPMDVQAKSLQLRNLGLQTQTAQQDFNDNQTLRALYQKHVQADGTVDTNGLLKDVYGAGLAKPGMALQKTILDNRKTNADIDESVAKTGQATAGAAKTNLDVTHEKASYFGDMLNTLVSKPDLTINDAISAMNDAVNKGYVTPQQGAAEVRNLPGDPNQLRAVLRQHAMVAMSVKDQVSNQIATAPQLKDTGGALTPVDPMTGQPTGGPSVTKTMTPGEASTAATAKAKLEWEKSGGLNDDAKQLAAERLLQGEPAAKVLGNLGRGQQGAQDLRAVQNLVATLAKDRGIDASGILSATQGVLADNRTATELGSREGKVAPRVQEAQNFAKLALDASADVPRGDFVPLTKAIQAGQSMSSDPKIARFQAANTSLINAYAAAVGGGTVSVSGQEHARQMLSTAQGPEAYKATVDQLLKETAGALAAPGQVRTQLGIGGKGAAPAAPSGAIVPIKSDADYNALSSGTQFIAPDGSHRVKP